MLAKALPQDVTKYCDLAYSLALDQTKSCYPVYSDGIKTRQDFMTAVRQNIEKETSELLLFLIDGTVEGWIGYFWIPEEHYLQLNMCSINRETQQALSELLDLLKEHFAGYTLYFGFPECNSDAVRFLRENGFDCIEEDWNYSFLFEHYPPCLNLKTLPESARKILTISVFFMTQNTKLIGTATGFWKNSMTGFSMFIIRSIRLPEHSPCGAITDITKSMA